MKMTTWIRGGLLTALGCAVGLGSAEARVKMVALPERARVVVSGPGLAADRAGHRQDLRDDDDADAAAGGLACHVPRQRPRHALAAA